MYKILLRIAAIIMLLHNVGHTIGHVGWKNETAEVNRRAIDAMVSNEFDFMGERSSYARFFDGYGYAGTITLLLAMVVLWMLSGNQSVLAKQLAFVMAIFLLSWAIMELMYFFPFAAAFSFVAAILAGWGAMKMNPVTQ
jgi:hypothetical protein